MPARRLVVAVASAVALFSLAVSSPARAAKDNPNNKNDGSSRRTTTTERRRTTTTERSTGTTRATSPTTTAKAPSTTATTTTPTTAAAKAEHTSSASTDSGAVTTTTKKDRPSKQYVVVLKKGNRSSTVADDHAKSRGVKVQRVLGHAVRGYIADIPDDEISQVKKDKRVAYVARPKPIQSFAQVLPWGVEKVSRIGDNWSSTRPGDGSGAVAGNVYVIDTGVDPNADLNAATEFNGRGGPNTDCYGHGTHMAGIVGAIDNASGVVGVAPGIRVHGVKVLDCSGKGTDLNALSGLDWVIANGQKPGVITMSFGGPISQAFDDGVRRAVAAGYTVIAAAGNEHRDACKLSPAHMGTLDGVITVGATTTKDRPASFSNFGKCVDVWAPGVKILSYFPGGQLASATGTSASAPHVAGVAALYLQGNTGAAPATVEGAVKTNAVHIGSTRKPLLRASSANF
jgi:subtilisin family serine protease